MNVEGKDKKDSERRRKMKRVDVLVCSQIMSHSG